MGFFKKWERMPVRWKFLIGIQSIATIGIVFHRFHLIKNAKLEAEMIKQSKKI